MADLKTNYVDDELDTSKNTKRKYNLINNPDGTVSLEDVTEYLTVGTTFGAADSNAITMEINKISASLGDLKFVTITQAQYNALAAKDANTLYVIVG